MVASATKNAVAQVQLADEGGFGARPPVPTDRGLLPPDLDRHRQCSRWQADLITAGLERPIARQQRVPNTPDAVKPPFISISLDLCVTSE
jgi:hypothetical protein